MQLIMPYMLLLELAPLLRVLAQVDSAPATPLTQWVFVMLAIVLAILVLGASVMSSRRGHRD